MMSEWRVYSTILAGHKEYGVYRLRDKDQIDHSGNRETYGEMFTKRVDAQKAADKLNSQEETT